MSKEYEVNTTLYFDEEEIDAFLDVDMLSVAAAIDSIYRAPKDSAFKKPSNIVLSVLLRLQKDAEKKRFEQ